MAYESCFPTVTNLMNRIDRLRLQSMEPCGREWRLIKRKKLANVNTFGNNKFVISTKCEE